MGILNEHQSLWSWSSAPANAATVVDIWASGVRYVAVDIRCLVLFRKYVLPSKGVAILASSFRDLAVQVRVRLLMGVRGENGRGARQVSKVELHRKR
jgi:hypothetical protein